MTRCELVQMSQSARAAELQVLFIAMTNHIRPNSFRWQSALQRNGAFARQRQLHTSFRTGLSARTIRVACPVAHWGEESHPLATFLRSRPQERTPSPLPTYICVFETARPTPTLSLYISRHRPRLWRRDSLVFGHRLTRGPTPDTGKRRG